MQDNATTDNPTPQLLMDSEDWELAFTPYKGNPDAVLRLGFNLAMLRMHLEAQTIKARQAIGALDCAMETLFPYSEFHDVSFGLFVRLTEGKLTFDEEQILSALGIKF
jgi:hypothetical protein